MIKRSFAILVALSMMLLSVTAFADVSIQADGYEIAGGESIKLTAVGGGADKAKYAWYRDGALIAGATGPIYLANQMGDYTVSYDGGTLSNVIDISRNLENPNNNSSTLVSKGSNKLADKTDSKVTKLEARVAQAVEAASQPSQTVTLGGLYQAVDRAVASGGALRMLDGGRLDSSVQAVMMRKISENGLRNCLHADTVADNAVVTRLTLTPSLIGSSVELGFTFADEATTAKLEKSFSNRMVVLNAAQQGSYGQSVEMIVKTDAFTDASSLHFYNYQASSNTCAPVSVKNVAFDENGYMHFTATSGGTIIISQGALTK